MNAFNPTPENLFKIRLNLISNNEYNILLDTIKEIFTPTARIRSNLNSYGLKYTLELHLKSKGITTYFSIDELFLGLYDTFPSLKYKRESMLQVNPNYLFNVAVKCGFKVFK